MNTEAQTTRQSHAGQRNPQLGHLARMIKAVVISAILLVPCVWQPRVGFGDFPSHVYNAWLATLIEHGKLHGMAIAHQNTNVLTDLILVWLLKRCSVLVAERLVLGVSVLIFFWGAFAFARAVSGKAPWAISPILAVISYGIVFQLGFSNFYLSTGLACLALALLWREPGWWKLAIAGALFALAWKAHPLPVGWALASFAYAFLIRRAKHRLSVLASACAATAIVGVVLRFSFGGKWEPPRLLSISGIGQAALHGPLYAAVALGILMVLLLHLRSQTREIGWRQWLGQPQAQLYLLLVIATVCIPLTFGIGRSWIGVVTERLSFFAAIFACTLLAGKEMRRPEKWLAAVLSCSFFALLFFDTRQVNRLESTLESMVAQVPPGSRVAALLNFPETRIQAKAKTAIEQDPITRPIAGIFYDPRFGVGIHHIIDRVCVERCISYANYEPATYQFQVRALPGTEYALLKGEDSGNMQIGSYRVKERDLPLYQIYPCGPTAFDLCGRWLRTGEINGSQDYPLK